VAIDSKSSSDQNQSASVPSDARVKTGGAGDI
jgi:hypothetical protein